MRFFLLFIIMEIGGAGVIDSDTAFFVLALLVLKLFCGLLFGTVRHSGRREREGLFLASTLYRLFVTRSMP